MKLRIPYLLLGLSLIPLLGGVVRLLRLSSGASSLPADERFLADPLPVLVHVLCALMYSLLGAFQFDPGLRRASPAWHRRAGWAVLVGGVLSAVSGLWMTLASAIPPALQGPLLVVARILSGATMAVALLLAMVAIGGGDVRSHRAWMIRAYALGQGAGTQALLLIIPALLNGGEVIGWSRDLWMTAAWVLNLLIAEWIVRGGRLAFSAPARPRLAASITAPSGETENSQ